jgi:hypothetical protein
LSVIFGLGFVGTTAHEIFVERDAAARSWSGDLQGVLMTVIAALFGWSCFGAMMGATVGVLGYWIGLASKRGD